MALSERRILKQVTILPAQDAIQVQWANQILRDDEVVSEQYHRKAYLRAQAAEFAAEVEGSAAYLAALSWDPNAPVPQPEPQPEPPAT